MTTTRDAATIRREITETYVEQRQAETTMGEAITRIEELQLERLHLHEELDKLEGRR